MAIETGRLYDSTGTLIPLPGPARPFASILPAGVESEASDRYRGYPSKNLTPRKIEQVLDAADSGDLYDWVELCEEIVEKDPKIGSVLHTRSAAVLGLVREIIPIQLDDLSTDEVDLAGVIAKFCDTTMQRTNLTELLGDLLDAIGKPLAVDWIDWDTDLAIPKRFRRIPTKHLRWALGSDEIRVFDPRKPTYSTGGEWGVPFEPFTTVRALNNERRDHPTRGGLLRSLVWYYLFKNTSIKDWVSMADRYGMPLRIFALDHNDFTNPELYEKAQAAIRSLGAGSSGVISKEWEVQIHAAASKSGAELYQTIIDYIDKAIAQVTLGHELSSQSSPGSGQLGITAALQVRQDVLEGDCENLSEIIRRDVLVPMVGWNFGWEKVHLAPVLAFDYQPPKDLVAEANVMSVVARTFPTLDFSEQQVRDTFGWEPPLEDATQDDVLTPRPSSPSPGFGGEFPQAPNPDPNGPDVTVNSTLAYRRRPRVSTSYKKATQAKIDRLGSRAVSRAASATAGWRRQLRELIQAGVRDGLSLHEMAYRVAKAYPDLKADEVEKVLHEQILLARLFGRSA